MRAGAVGTALVRVLVAGRVALAGRRYRSDRPGREQRHDGRCADYLLFTTYLTFTLPFSIWMLVGYLDSIPRDLDEAAKVDGTGAIGALLRVVVPAAMPGIIAVAVYSFMTAWGEVLFASVMTNNSTRTLAVGLQGYSTLNQVYWNQVIVGERISTAGCFSSLMNLGGFRLSPE